VLCTDTFVLKSDTDPDLVAVSAKEEKLVPIAIATAQLISDLFNFIIILLEIKILNALRYFVFIEYS